MNISHLPHPFLYTDLSCAAFTTDDDRLISSVQISFKVTESFLTNSKNVRWMLLDRDTRSKQRQGWSHNDGDEVNHGYDDDKGGKQSVSQQILLWRHLPLLYDDKCSKATWTSFPMPFRAPYWQKKKPLGTRSKIPVLFFRRNQIIPEIVVFKNKIFLKIYMKQKGNSTGKITFRRNGFSVQTAKLICLLLSCFFFSLLFKT